MTENKKLPITTPDLKQAALRILKYSNDLKTQINENEDGSCNPTSPLPIDQALYVLKNRTRSPKLIHTATKRPSGVKFPNLHIDVYFHVEQAFTKAGMIVGENSAGQKQKIETLKKRLELADNAINELNLKTFTVKTNLLFRENPLPNRRGDRFIHLSQLETNLTIDQLLIQKVIQYCDADIIALGQLAGIGRPTNIQKETFAQQIADLWLKLTGKRAVRKVDSPFGRFLIAAWQSGFKTKYVDDDFERALKRIIPKKGTK